MKKLISETASACPHFGGFGVGFRNVLELSVLDVHPQCVHVYWLELVYGILWPFVEILWNVLVVLYLLF